MSEIDKPANLTAKTDRKRSRRLSKIAGCDFCSSA